MKNTIINGDSLSELKKLSTNSIDCIVTSPPYFQQRNYDMANQIGQESSVEEYVSVLRQVFNECRRILKPTGTLWLNLGDKYKNKQMLGMPWRVAIALQDDGWILRNDVIWHKPNAMPSSSKDRLTVDHEYVFMFVKDADSYIFNQDLIREPHVTFSEKSKMKGGRNHFGKRNSTPEIGKNINNPNLHDGRWDQAFHPLGRNKRTVWNIPLSKFRGAHFAVFPVELADICIRASCSENSIVLDPFFGSGTTGVSAIQNSCNYLGIELNPKYIEIANKRLIDAMKERQELIQFGS